jgi:hypothetical protein
VSEEEIVMTARVYRIASIPLFLVLMSTSFDCKHATEPPLAGPDTTSHNFSWTIDRFGDGSGSSRLYGVAIINDTLAYAVGEVYKKDSLGQYDPLPYNLVRWDGTSWRLQRVSVQTRYGLVTAPLEGIFAFSPSDIWLVGTDPIHGDGRNWADVDVRAILGSDSITVSKAWGTSSSNIYFVGRLGNIVFFDGTSWHRLLSGTTLPIQDIWGSVDLKGQSTEICAVASNIVSLPAGKRVCRITSTSATAMSDSGLSVALGGVWFAQGTMYYVVGAGIYFSSSISQSTIWQGGYNIITPYWSGAIRGNAPNDIFIAGGYGDVLHFNGSTWKSFQTQTAVDGNYRAVAVQGDLVIAVGDDADLGAIAMGRRY